MSDHRSQVGVAFVNFHSEMLIAPRADDLLRAGFVVSVVDNSGTFPSTDDIRLITPRENLGFGAACNRAAAKFPSSVQALCFHNPDVHVEATALDSLVARLRAQSIPGASAPAEDLGRKIRTNGYRYPSAIREALLAARSLLPRPGIASPGFSGEVRNNPPRHVKGRGRRFAGGGLLVVDRDAHDRIGGFDEDFFLYAEDLDYWHRLEASGAEVAIVPSVVARHDASTGSPMGGMSREILRWLGVELFAAKHGWRWEAMRKVHTSALPFASRAAPRLAAAVDGCWERGLGPLAVMRQLMPSLRSGVLVDGR